MIRVQLKVKEFIQIGTSRRLFEILQIKNSIRWSVGQPLTEPEMQDIINLNLAEVTII